MSKWTLNIGICLMWMIVIETWTVMTQRTDQYLPKPHATDTICQSFQQNSGSNLNILAIGTTSSGYLRLITKNNLSYVMPAYALDPTNKKLYLMTWPQPLDIQLSKFFNYYKPIMKFNSLVWLMFDQDSDWICVATNYSQTQDAFNYDIKHKSAITGWYYLEANLIVLSTSAKCKFYTIQVSTSLRIDSWQCEKSIKEFPKILPKTGYDSVICFDESGNNITIVRVKDEPAYCIKPVQWPIFKGFVDSGNFYLFGHSYVYVFDEAAYYDDREIYPFQQIRYDSFFQCIGFITPNKPTKPTEPSEQPTEPSEPTKKTTCKKSYLCWIILVIIMLIWIFMVIIWSIFFTCRRRRARQQLSIHEKTIRSGPMNSKYIFSKLLTKRSRKSKASRMNSISLQNGAAQPTVMVDNQAASSAGSICVDSNMISNTSASRSKRPSKRSPSSRRAH